MRKYIILFLLGTIITGLLSFLVLEGTGAAVAKLFFIGFVILFVGSLLYDPRRRRYEI